MIANAEMKIVSYGMAKGDRCEKGNISLATTAFNVRADFEWRQTNPCMWDPIPSPDDAAS